MTGKTTKYTKHTKWFSIRNPKSAIRNEMR